MPGSEHHAGPLRHRMRHLRARWRRAVLAILLALHAPEAIAPPPAGAVSVGTHMVVGAVLGYRLAAEPWSAFAVGLVSHAALDAVPHNDALGWPQWVLLAAGVWGAYDVHRRSGQDGRVLWGALGGTLPDAEHLLRRWDILQRPFFPSHTGWIRQPRASSVVGLAIELGLEGLAVSWSF